jgi:hypothetical protein
VQGGAFSAAPRSNQERERRAARGERAAEGLEEASQAQAQRHGEGNGRFRSQKRQAQRPPGCQVQDGQALRTRHQGCHFNFRRKEDEIAAEARLDGLYVIRTSLPKEAIGAQDAVSAYKSLSQVERAFRSLKTVDLEIRPIHHWLSDRVRAHVFLCMLAYYAECHTRQKLAPVLFGDEDKEAALASRPSPAGKAPRSDRAKAKDACKRTEDGQPVHSLHTLIADLGTLCLNEAAAAANPDYALAMTTRPTPLQQKALDLLGVSLRA